MTLSPGALGKTSVAYEHRMTSDNDAFPSCLPGHPLTSELAFSDSFLFFVNGKEYKFTQIRN